MKQYSSPRLRDATIFRSSQQNYFQSPGSIQSLEKNLITVAFQDLLTNKKKKSWQVLLSYLNIYSLQYKTNDLRVLVSKVLPHYLSYLLEKSDEEFSIIQFLIEKSDIATKS